MSGHRSSGESSRYAMIMAGGSGTRLWPMSRKRRPKQLLPFIGERSLLEAAADRLEGAVPLERRWICTGETWRPLIHTALPSFPDAQILGEPVGRNTTNAVGFTAAILARRDPDAVFAVLTADHLIEPASEFRRSLEVAFALAENDRHRFVTFAITPTFAATSYGWVERGDPVPGFDRAFLARGFEEKPPLETAERHLASGTWGWNSGMFVYHAGAFMDALAEFQPASYEGLIRIAGAWDTSDAREVLDAVYPTLPSISVDYGVMEPAATHADIDICCVPMDVSWMDVGSWPSYGETLDADAEGNRTNAHAIHIDSQNVLAVSDDAAHTIATVGCKDLIIVHTADATLVCPASEAQRVRDLAERAPQALR